jgi:hypothetical protein
MLDWLDPSQVIYCDTDSVVFVVNKKNPKHKHPHNDQELPDKIKFGDSLGCWSDEMKGIAYIKEIVVGGAKSYAYTTSDGKIVCKQKRITLDMANSEKINFQTMKDMILNNKSLESEPRFTFSWLNISKDVITKHIKKSIRSTVSEKRTIDGYDTLPYGFEA